MRRSVIAAAMLLMATVTVQAASDDPSDVTVGKPADISQDLFVRVRTACTREWGDDFRMRVYCEKKQFEAIRKLRGDR